MKFKGCAESAIWLKVVFSFKNFNLGSLESVTKSWNEKGKSHAIKCYEALITITDYFVCVYIV